MRKTSQRALTLVAGRGSGLLDTDDLSDLPAELIKELSTRETDVLEDQIVSVLRACGGSADLDQILIGLYRKHQVAQKRRFLQNKLWRMVRKGRVLKTKSARGIFKLASEKPRRERRRK